MEFDLVLKIAAVGLIVAVLHQILCKIGRDEYAMLMVLAGILVILMMLLPRLLELLETVQGIIPMAMM
ncbi:MAG: stage III sporulation protein AC [Oscillospiraceae bacterium]|jgi:stage III sporulation protein AC|nr:stage III sporulation protein AC [Oscillospiraceae bacterium]